MTKTHKTIAVDFDGTLADNSRVKYPDLGPPIPTMVERVRRWIQDGHTVKIFSARLAPQKSREEEKQQVKALTEWLDLIGLTQKDGRPLVLTATKLPEFDEFWDDKAIGVIRNTGSTYFEAEHYRDNYDPKSGMFGATKEESSRPRTPQDVTGNGAQLELQFGGAEYEQFYSSDPGKLHPSVREFRRLRGDYDTPLGLFEQQGLGNAGLRVDPAKSKSRQPQTAAIPQGYHQERQGICTGPSLGPIGQYVTGVDGRSYLRLDHATPGLASYTSFTTFEDLATDPREPYTR